MKRILLIHNNYRSTGGEDIAVKNELEMLQRNFEIKTLIYDNKIQNIFDLISFFTLSNTSVNKEIISNVEEFNPDLVYFHNTWFKVSLGIFKYLNNKKIKVMVKIHNFRYDCTKSLDSKKHLINEEFCYACGFSNKNVFSFNKYFNQSYLKSLFSIYFGKKYLKILKNENTYIAVLTSFHKKFLKDRHLKSKNVFVIPNFIQTKKLQMKPNKDYFIYAGRISKEKGIEQMIESFLSSNLNRNSLKIVGDGPLYKNLLKKYNLPNIEFLGTLSNEKTLSLIANSSGVISGTRLYEGQPTLLCEASMLGVPVVFPDTGGIKEFLPSEYDFLYKQFDYESLVNKLNSLTNKKLVNKNTSNAHLHILEKLNEVSIIKIFQEVIASND
tara:strand:- start:11115 stop:12263 length:1149 start_codon:yes stop_codon:yes gene_type:complete